MVLSGIFTPNTEMESIPHLLLFSRIFGRRGVCVLVVAAGAVVMVVDQAMDMGVPHNGVTHRMTCLLTRLWTMMEMMTMASQLSLMRRNYCAG